MVRVAIWRRLITIGIKKEKGVWESRTPLTPSHVQRFLAQKKDLKFIVQPSHARVFTDNEFAEAGAKIDDNLGESDLIIGVKEVPKDQIIPGKTYMCFSHTHKGQKHNMDMLHKFINTKSSLLDYELLTDDSGQRLVAFGRFAGYAGMINCLHGVGLQLLRKGYRTPFVNIAPGHTYPSLGAARQSLQLAGQAIKEHSLPKDLHPLLFLFIGNGNVSQGAQEMAKELQIKFIAPSEVLDLGKRSDGRTVYGCVLGAHDYCVRKDGQPFTMEKYMGAPDLFASVFYEQFAPYATAIINGIYWEPKYPRLLTHEQVNKLLLNQASRLVTIADISCDINGSIESTHKATTIEEPFYYITERGLDAQIGSTPSIQMMTVDNLPAQLPKDASEYFGDRLYPIIEEYIRDREAGTSAVLNRATIVRKGQLAEKYSWLRRQLPHGDATIGLSSGKRVLVLGSGYVAGPTIKHLGSRSDVQIVIGTDNAAEAQRLVSLAPNTSQIEALNINDAIALGKLVSAADVVVSLVPATMHLPVAQACLTHGKHLVTASYISPSMAALDGQVKGKGLLFLNEIGLDPGLDHLSAKKIIDEIQAAGKCITSFTSWCGGLPAPEAADNPLGYKFSWSPRGVLLAALNDARYLRNGSIVEVSGKDLLASVTKNPFISRFNLEGLPNRDSTKYIDLYGLGGPIRTMLRGTLRYQGFSDLMRCFHALGLLSLEAPPSQLKQCLTWTDVRQHFLTDAYIDFKLKEINAAALRVRVMECLEWLGMLQGSEPFDQASTLLDSFCKLLQRKLCYGSKEVDLVIMQHMFTVEDSNTNTTEYLSSSLIEYGQVGGFSAMARTVGYPVAVAAEMILDGQLGGSIGVKAPLSRTMYEPLLSRLEQVAGIKFKEHASKFKV